MKVLYMGRKGQQMNIWERFHIYKLSKDGERNKSARSVADLLQDVANRKINKTPKTGFTHHNEGNIKKM
jgi:hypothetical protein